MRRGLFFGLLILLLGGGWLLLAQSEDDALDELNCDQTELIVIQADYQFLLRDFQDQLEADPEAALEQLYEIGQVYQDLAIECGFIPDDIGERFVGEDVDMIMTALENLNGDPLNGQLLYNNEADATDGNILGCVGCHMNEEVAPLTEGTWTRWDEIRSELEQFEDYTFERYMVESFVLPWDYTVPGYPEGTMPNNFGERLSYQDLADLIAYLYGQDQLLD